MREGDSTSGLAPLSLSLSLSLPPPKGVLSSGLLTQIGGETGLRGQGEKERRTETWERKGGGGRGKNL